MFVFDLIRFIEYYAQYDYTEFSSYRLEWLVEQVVPSAQRWGVDVLLRRLSDDGDALLMFLLSLA